MAHADGGASYYFTNPHLAIMLFRVKVLVQFLAGEWHTARSALCLDRLQFLLYLLPLQILQPIKLLRLLLLLLQTSPDSPL